MTIADAFKVFIKAVTGKEPAGCNISEVIRDGASKFTDKAVLYADDGKSIILNSSTTDSTKQFKIIVTDDGTVTATEVTAG